MLANLSEIRNDKLGLSNIFRGSLVETNIGGRILLVTFTQSKFIPLITGLSHNHVIVSIETDHSLGLAQWTGRFSVRLCTLMYVNMYLRSLRCQQFVTFRGKAVTRSFPSSLCFFAVSL